MPRRLVHLVSFLIAFAAACRLTEAGAPGGEPGPGARAVLIHETLQVAGGRPQLTVVTFDSAAATFVEQSCDGGSDVTTCPNLQVRSGLADHVLLSAVFDLTATAEFRALRASYGFEDGQRPPDVHQVTVTVVAGGRRRTVTRDVRAPAPTILGRLDCRLLQARGALILCT